MPQGNKALVGHCCSLNPFLKIQRAWALQGHQAAIQLLSGVSPVQPDPASWHLLLLGPLPASWCLSSLWVFLLQCKVQFCRGGNSWAARSNVVKCHSWLTVEHQDSFGGFSPTPNHSKYFFCWAPFPEPWKLRAPMSSAPFGVWTAAWFGDMDAGLRVRTLGINPGTAPNSSVTWDLH